MLPSLRNRKCYRDYTIYDEDDSLRVIKDIDKQEKERLAKISSYQPGKSNSAAAGANPDGLYEAMSHLSLQSGDATSAAQAAVAEVLGDAGGGGAGGDGVDGDKEGNRLKNIRDAVLRYKEGGMKEDMRGRVGERRRGRFEGELSIGGSIPRYAKLYEEELRRSNALDFDDLTHFLLDLFHTQPHVLQKYQERFQHVLVDEFQDTDSFQYEIVRLLTLNSKRLFVVGDIDQCIYSWRGAEYHYLQRLLDEDFDDVTTLQLRSNYRSSQSILQAANRVIQGGPRDRRVGGGTLELKPTKPPGHPVFFSFFPSCASEAATIAEEIESLVDPAELSPWRGQAGSKGGAEGHWEGRGRGRKRWVGGWVSKWVGGLRAVQLQQGLADLAIPCIAVGGSTLFQRKAVQLQQGLANLAIPCIVVGGSTLFQRKIPDSLHESGLKPSQWIARPIRLLPSFASLPSLPSLYSPPFLHLIPFPAQVVKDLVAYMRMVANPADSVALGRIYNTPSRGIPFFTPQRYSGAYPLQVLRPGGLGMSSGFRASTLPFTLGFSLYLFFFLNISRPRSPLNPGFPCPSGLGAKSWAAVQQWAQRLDSPCRPLFPPSLCRLAQAGLGAKSWATVQQWAQGLDSPAGTAILELALGKHADNPPSISKKASFAHLILSFRRAVGTLDGADSSLGASNLSDSSQRGNTGGTKELPHAGGLLGTIVDVLELKQEYSPAAAAAAAAKSRSPNPAVLRQRHEEDGKRALDQMERLQDLANRFGPTCGVGMEGVRNFLEQIALLSGEIHESEGKEAQLSANAVRLMTIHKAKGLEFPVVFLTGLENRILPLAPKNYKEMAQWKGSEERPGGEGVKAGQGVEAGEGVEEEGVKAQGNAVVGDADESAEYAEAAAAEEESKRKKGSKGEKNSKRDKGSKRKGAAVVGDADESAEYGEGAAAEEQSKQKKGSKRERRLKRELESERKKALSSGGNVDAAAGAKDAALEAECRSEGSKRAKKGSKRKRSVSADVEASSVGDEALTSVEAAAEAEKILGKEKRKKTKRKGAVSDGSANEVLLAGVTITAEAEQSPEKKKKKKKKQKLAVREVANEAANEAAAGDTTAAEAEESHKKKSKRNRVMCGGADDETAAGDNTAAEAEELHVERMKKKKSKLKGAVDNGAVSEAVTGAGVSAEALQAHGTKEEKEEKKETKKSKRKRTDDGAASEAAAGDDAAAEAEQSRVGKKKKKKKSKRERAASDGVKEEETGAEFAEERSQEHGASLAGATEAAAAEEGSQVKGKKRESEQEKRSKREKAKRKRGNNGNEETSSIGNGAAATEGVEVAAAGEQPRVSVSKLEKKAGRKRALGSGSGENGRSDGMAVEGAGVAVAEEEQPRVKGSKRRRVSVHSALGEAAAEKSLNVCDRLGEISGKEDWDAQGAWHHRLRPNHEKGFASDDCSSGNSHRENGLFEGVGGKSSCS
ncbi:unnamed protein product [Closterium sp. Naga37s-1]|nr:unnamed protein product [Closterium sp. Naga37s-1]